MSKVDITINPMPVETLPVKDYKLLIQKMFKNNLMKEINMPEQNLKGVNETLDVLKFAVSLTNIVGDITSASSAGGSKVTLMEMPAFFPLVFKIAPMVTGIKEVPAELIDKITPEEKEQIKAVIREVNAIKNNADLDQAVEDFLEWALMTKHLVTKYVIK